VKYFRKILLYCILLPLLCIAVARFCHHQTKGFRIAKVQNNLMDSGHDALNAEEIRWIRSLFAYKFRYLGRGHQSFVFLSDDDAHVIKIFNNCQQSNSAFFRMLKPIPWLGRWAERQARFCEENLRNTANSYRIALEEMPDKTALLFLHARQTENLPPLTIVDPLNITHRLNANPLGFLIQKKAKLAYPMLEEWIQAQNLEAAKRALCKLLDLFIWKCRQGIADNDPLIRTNFGFIEEEAIQIDVGPLSKNPSIQDVATMQKEIIRISTSLKNWLSEKCPELCVFLDEQLQERLSLKDEK
jgi:hypothetical protein